GAGHRPADHRPERRCKGRRLLRNDRERTVRRQARSGIQAPLRGIPHGSGIRHVDGYRHAPGPAGAARRDVQRGSTRIREKNTDLEPPAYHPSFIYFTIGMLKYRTIWIIIYFI